MSNILYELYKKRTLGQPVSQEEYDRSINYLNNFYGNWDYGRKDIVDAYGDNYGLSYDTPETVSPAVARMRNLGYGRLPMQDLYGGYGCTRAIGIALNGTPLGGVTMVDQLANIAKAPENNIYEEYKDDFGNSGEKAQAMNFADLVSKYGLKGGDVIIYGDYDKDKNYDPYYHAVMVGDPQEHTWGNSILQNGTSRGTVYEMDAPYFTMKPTGVIRSSIYNDRLRDVNDVEQQEAMIMKAFQNETKRNNAYREQADLQFAI